MTEPESPQDEHAKPHAAPASHSDVPGSQSPALIGRAIANLQDFLHLEAAGGLILMAAAALALLIANSPLSGFYSALLGAHLEVSFADYGIDKPLLLWINDGLMAVFFFLVGMELKREVLEGHLSSLRRASLPAFAAAGGMLVPAACYIALNRGNGPMLEGWAIPTATDIAFALGVLSLLGPRVPPALKAFLLSVAIFDDLGAIVIIALFYTSDLSTMSLAVSAVMIVGLACLNRFGVMRPAAYFMLGIPLWIAVLNSGVHATLAGVVLAMFIPLRPPKGSAQVTERTSTLHDLEHALHPWVAFGVLPLFAFANAGVSLAGVSLSDLGHPVPLGIMIGLLIGKPVGILLTAWLAVRLRVASLPEAVNWRQLQGAALLCGIGFTMSLFIASLAFGPRGGYSGLEQLGILIGSIVSGILGYLWLRVALPVANRR